MNGAVELVLAARGADLPGGLHVLRALPQARRRMVGPFVFLDQMGPAEFATGQEVKILSHPHIGLSTVTYLFEGEGVHRDSLGVVQKILPGDVNWMTAGKGIVHAEQLRGPRAFGIQIWVALPKQFEEMDPTFHHHDAAELPLIEDGGTRIRIVAGSLFGKRSPVRTHSELFYADVTLAAGAKVKLSAEHHERAAYVVSGDVAFSPGELAVFRPGEEVVLEAKSDSRVLLLGGEPLEGPRHIYWNFVSSSKERIEQAKTDWQAQAFAKVPGETEVIPLPEQTPPRPVNYP